MSCLLLIDLFGYELTAFEFAGGIIALIIGAGALVKSVKEIRKDGWEPFRDRWITPRQARLARQEQLVHKFESLAGVCESQGAMIGEILKEVKPNGGESLKDRIINIDSKLENVVARSRHQDDTSEVPTFQLDDEGQMTYTNAAFRELVDAEDAQLHHSNYLSLIDVEQRSRFIRELEEAIKFKMPIDAIVTFKRTGPGTKTVRIQASPDVRHGGILKGFFCTASEAVI